MTATEPRPFDHPDARAFLRAICDTPDDDTARLVFADWLDEQLAPQLVCAECNGKGGETHGWGTNLSHENCLECGNTGLVTDRAADGSLKARAELIRVQCELANWPCECDTSEERVYHDECRCKERGEFQRRESALLAANGERWRKGPKCEKCEGSGELFGKAPENRALRTKCPACWGGDAGGLMRKFFYPPPGFDPEDGLTSVDLSEPVRVTYSRGSPVVTVPHAADVWERVACPACKRKPRTIDHRLQRPITGSCVSCKGTGFTNEHRPTAWISAVCLHHPDVIEVAIGDKQPFRYLDKPNFFGWSRDRPTYRDDPRNVLPPEIWDLLPPGGVYPTEPAAGTVFARAVPRWIRSFPEVKA